MYLIAICIICISIAKSYGSMTIENDRANDGIIRGTYEDVYVQNKTIKIVYSMDVSVIDTVMNRINGTLVRCRRNMVHEMGIYRDFETENGTIDENGTSREFHLIDLLHIENENLSLKSKYLDECTAIINITRSVKALVNRLNEIKKGDENSILEIVSINKLMHDVKINTISERKKKPTLPFKFNYWFIYNLFNHSKYTFAKVGKIIQFGFEIPLFNKKQLARIYTKPVVIDNIPYRYRLGILEQF